MTKNKLAIVLVISILVNGLVLSCGRADKAVFLDEIETTTFAIAETTDTIQESSQKQSETKVSISTATNSLKTERLEGSSQQTMQTVSNTAITETGEQNSETNSTTVKTITEESKANVTEPKTTNVENATTIPAITETTTKKTTTVLTARSTTEEPVQTTVMTPTPAPEFYNRVDTATFIQQAFAEVNRMRAEVGEDPVSMAPNLIQDYAMLRAKEEGSEGSAFHFDHQRPNGEMALDYPFQLWIDGKVDQVAISENISTVGVMEPYSQYGDGMVRSFQESTGHYNNIVSPDAGSVGIGYYYNEEVWLPYIVLIFLEK